jgi:hypothetical protein
MQISKPEKTKAPFTPRSTTNFEVNTINTMRDIEQKQQNLDTVVVTP